MVFPVTMLREQKAELAVNERILAASMEGVNEDEF